MTEQPHAPHRAWLVAAGLAAVAAFGVLAGRFWHPYYGFTKFVQLDEADARTGIHEIREHPVFAYEGFNGYDGAAYVQIAFHPLLDSPELQPAIGNVPYRARRILGSALAWLIAGGSPARIAGVYAALNIGVWLVFAALLWRVLPVLDARSWWAWITVLFSAGALHSVRLALTDLLAATLAVAGIWLGERGRGNAGIGVLAAAGLARETALAAVVGFWRGPWSARRSWRENLTRTAVVALPLLIWILYVRWKAGTAAQGFGNFTWPVAGWIEKWFEATAEIRRQPQFRWLATTTLLATIALTVQAAYFLVRRRRDDPWWRVGVVGVAMMALLGTSVWEGHPGAATRVLLPMTAAFAIYAVRQRAGWAWLLGGGLGIFSGVLALWTVPNAPHELSAGRFSGGAYVVRVGAGWYGVERDRRAVWAWAAQQAALAGEIAPRENRQIEVELKLRAIAARPIEIRAGENAVWKGTLGERAQRIAVRVPVAADGKFAVEIRSEAPPLRENETSEARRLGFAVYGAVVRAVP